MKLVKLLSILMFVVFFISSASAVLVHGQWEDSSQDINVIQGDVVEFDAEFFSINPPMTITAKLYDSNYNVVETFEDSVINAISHFPTYTINSSLYPIGNYELILNGEDEINSDSHTVSLTINPIPDTNIPVIELIGENPITILQGTTYVDEGATAYDIEDGDLTANITTFNPVDTNVLGTYLVTYNVQDSAGNWAAQVTRTVTVVDSLPNDAPTITLVGGLVTLNVGDTYVEPGYIAYDAQDGDLTGDVVVGGDTIDTSTIGVYVLTYNVQDSDGNDAPEVTRTVAVVESGTDVTPPITTVIVPQPSTYSDDEFTFHVLTNEASTIVYSLDGAANISMNEIAVNEFMSALLTLSDGAHSVTFYATDLAGNMASETVDFSVDTGITTFNMNVIVPEQGEEYDSEITFRVEVDVVAEVTFSLNDEPNVTMDFQGTNNGILTFTYEEDLTDGDYEITFYAEDSSGTIISETVSFTVNKGFNKKKKKPTEENDFYDKKYKEQTEYVNTPIHLNEEPEELTNCQKFLAWFKNTFGFDFFYFLLALFAILCILLAIYVVKKYQDYNKA